LISFYIIYISSSSARFIAPLLNFAQFIFIGRPSFEILKILQDPLFSLSVVYLEGSALKEKDLSRAKAETAIAIFIMTNKFSPNPDQEDATAILQQFNIRYYQSLEFTSYLLISNWYLGIKNRRYIQATVRSNPLFCIQLIRPENRRHLSSYKTDSDASADLIICLNEIKMGMIAKSVLFPGANTLVFNLLCSFADEADDEDTNKNIQKSEIDMLEDNDVDTWDGEYQRGCDWEIYTTKMHTDFVGANFIDIATALYEKLGIILLGLQIGNRKYLCIIR
jgi:hypothetical protein